MIQVTQERVAGSRLVAVVVLLAALVVAWLALLVAAAPAHAATFAVDRNDDPDPATAKACTDAPDDCSLRGAIVSANTAADPDDITLPAGPYTLTRDGDFEGMGRLAAMFAMFARAAYTINDGLYHVRMSLRTLESAAYPAQTLRRAA